MRQHLQKSLLVLTSLLIVACGGGGSGSPQSNIVLPPPTPQPPIGAMGDGRLDEIVEWVRASHALPSLATIVVHQNQVTEVAAVGTRSINGSAAVTTDDKWHLGSLTKSMTATLAGVLVEMSVVSWDTTPLDVWPELDSSINPQFRTITLRNLLSHTSGLRRVNEAPSKYGDLTSGTFVEKRRAFAAELLSGAPIGPIGRSDYSNGGFIVAGAMLETMMSAPYETLLQDYVFAPLGMIDSGFGAPGTAGMSDQPLGHRERVGGYEPVEPGAGADNPQVFAPAGTVHTTLQDYANYMIAHINGARGFDGIVTAQTFSVLHAPVDNGSALGWGVGPSGPWRNHTELAHGGSNLRWYAIVRLIPGLDGGALFITNAGGENADDAIDVLDDLIADRYMNAQ